jgi:DNA (cytosine-5)-methyltransferase 1
MHIAGLFAGIGGLELGFEAAGHSASLFCEIDPAAQHVLSERFPGVRIVSDIRQLDALPKGIEVVTAGFPCQDLSQAGKTAGLAGTRSALVGDVFRLLEKADVPTVVLENVPFMLQLARGDAMRWITDELERLDYQWAWRVVDTYGFGLPQRRERVLLVGSREVDPATVLLADEEPLERPSTDFGRWAHGFYWTEGNRGLGWAVDSIPTLKVGSSLGIPAPPAIVMRDGAIIKPHIVDAERLQGFPADWTLPAETITRASRRWTLVGNAVSVPVAKWLGTRLATPGQYDSSLDLPFAASGPLPKAARYDGKKRYAVKISADPLGIRPPHLHKFLAEPGTPLSTRATRGFLGRARKEKIRLPMGFLELLERHLERMAFVTV